MSKYEFPLPDTGEGLHEAEILAWFVKVGDEVAENDALVEVQTDKAVVEITSPVSGKVEALGAEQGETLKVGETLVYLTDVQSSSVSAEVKEEKTESSPASKEETKVAPVENKSKNPITNRVKAAPSVRKAAREAGIDLSLIKATGPKGRVLRKDLENFIARKDENSYAFDNEDVQVTEVAKEDEVVPIKGLRKIIFENMKTAYTNAVHCTGMDEVEVTRLVTARENLLAYAEQLNVKLTYLPFIIKAVSIALQKHRVFNSHVNDEQMTVTYRKDIHIGVAMAIEEGLVVPVIRHANKKSIMQIAKEVNELSHKARNQQLSPQELTGSTFTISSTGAKGGWYATPIINYPEVAILGVHKIKKQPIVVKNHIEIGHMMGMSLTFDHRIIDGEPAGNFMAEVAKILCAPEIFMVEN